MFAYRFLSEEYALQAIRENRLRISRFAELNDPFEWAPPIAKDKSQRQAFRRMKDELGRDRGLICFSKEWSNPLLWSHYADKHRGIALGYEIVAGEPFEVEYRNERVECDWERLVTDPEYGLDIVRSVMCSKSEHWSYEDEVRVHVALDHSTSEEGHHFLNCSDALVLKEVIVGANCDLRKSKLEEICSASRAQPALKKARIAFKSYNVVQQQNEALWR